LNSSRQSEKSRSDNDKQNPAEEKNTTDIQLNDSANIDHPSKSSSNSSVTEINETNIDEGKKSKDREKKDVEKDFTKDTDSDHKSSTIINDPQNRSSVRFDVKPLPDEDAFIDEEAVGIRQSASGSAVHSPTSSIVDSPSFISLPDETRKRRSKSRGSGRVEKTATDVKKDAARSRSKSKSEGTKKKADSSPDSGYAFKRREDIEKEAKKKKKEEDERKKKEEEEAKKKKKEEEERKKKEEKEAKKEKSERRKSRKGLVPSLSMKSKDKDLLNGDSGAKTLTSRDSKDDLHIRPKSSIAEERGGIKSKKSMPSLKLKSISPRGERKGSNPPFKDSKTSSDSSSNKPSPIQIPVEVEPKSEPAKTDRPRTRSLHRSASTEKFDNRTARNAPEPPPIPTPDGAGTFRKRKRSLSTNELKGDGTDAALTSTEPISIGKLASENKQREDTYVNILKKSIRDILVGTNMKIEREELTKVMSKMPIN
jgi:hypothetical protein